MSDAIRIPLCAVHLATEGHGETAEELAVLEPDGDETMSMLEVHAVDFDAQVRPQLLEWFDEKDLEGATLEDLIQAVLSLPGLQLVLSLQAGGAWSLTLEPLHRRQARNFVRLDRRSTQRKAPVRDRQLTVGNTPALASVLDVSDDGSGIAIDCDADELRALLMEGALREPGAHAMEIKVVRVQALGEGRFRVGCVVDRGQNTARQLLS